MAVGVDEQVRAALTAADAETGEPGRAGRDADGNRHRPADQAKIDRRTSAPRSNSMTAPLRSVPATHALLAARIHARKATALQALPESGTASLEKARDALNDGDAGHPRPWRS